MFDLDYSEGAVHMVKNSLVSEINLRSFSLKTSTPERIRKLTDAGLWGDKTLCDYLRIQAKNHPNILAAADQHTREQLTGSPPLRLTFLELDNASDALAIDLCQRGVACGDRVMLQMPNVVDLMVLYYALSKLGAIASPYLCSTDDTR